MLASLRAKRRWFFGRNGADSPGGGDEGDERITHSMLGSLASEADVLPVRAAGDSGGAGAARRAGRGGDEDDERITHSMLGLLASEAPADVAPAPAARSVRGTRGRHEDDEAVVHEDGESLVHRDDESIVHSMLGSLASAAPADVAPEPATRSLLSLSAAGAEGSAAAAGPEAAAAPGGLIIHSTIAEIAGLEERPTSPFPIERGILISLVVHVLLVVLFLSLPSPLPVHGKGDLFALTPPEKDDSPIPVIFQDAPGPARENPKRSPLSDADRRAGGGDSSRPKAQAPYVPPSSGIAGLAPGPKAPRGAPAQRPPRSAAAPDRQPEAAVASEGLVAPSGKDASEFPVQQPRSGPRETTRLAGLDTAIREAARGTVAGQGGSPEGNPDGGFVDSGPLSFDTTWYDWGPYAAEMIRRIKLHWDVPELARLGWKGKLTVRFFILADGRVADAKILRGSGIPPFDFAAFQAIVKSSPFRPLPADLGSQREGVTVTFFYNMRPESDGERTGGKPGE